MQINDIRATLRRSSASTMSVPKLSHSDPDGLARVLNGRARNNLGSVNIEAYTGYSSDRIEAIKFQRARSGRIINESFIAVGPFNRLATVAIAS